MLKLTNATHDCNVRDHIPLRSHKCGQITHHHLRALTFETNH
jgi:hypothetical protein